MIKKYNNISLLLGAPGCLAQIVGIAQQNPAVQVVGTVFLIAGLMYYARAKGRSAAWGLFGVLSIIGLIVLARLKDLTPVVSDAEKRLGQDLGDRPPGGAVPAADPGPRTDEQEALALHAGYGARSPLMRLWFMALLLAAILLLGLFIAGIPKAFHEVGGVIATLCLGAAWLTIAGFLAALGVYCYAKLFPLNPKSPEWKLEIMATLAATPGTEWLKAVFGVVVWVGVLGAIGEHFSTQATPDEELRSGHAAEIAQNAVTPEVAQATANRSTATSDGAGERASQKSSDQSEVPSAVPAVAAEPPIRVFHDETTYVAKDDAYIYKFTLDARVRVKLVITVDGDAPIDIFTLPGDLSKDEYMKVSTNVQMADGMREFSAAISMFSNDASAQGDSSEGDLSSATEKLFSARLAKRGLYHTFESDWQPLRAGTYSMVVDNTDAFTPARGDAPVRIQLFYQQM